MSTRGGPQRIPRPSASREGDAAPWSTVPPDERIITAVMLRTVFTGRVGLPSLVEGDANDRRRSAVLAPFYDLDGDLQVVLTRRSWGLRSHTGEVSFPGGRTDEGETPRDAALREAREEIDLDSSTVEILGELDHLMTVSSRSFIVPYVALLPDVPALHPNPDEVDAVLHVPVRELLLDGVYREERWLFETPPPWASPQDIEVNEPMEGRIFFFELVGDTVWGATAAMLRQLLSLSLGVDVGIDHA